jgi:hypothetical protein
LEGQLDVAETCRSSEDDAVVVDEVLDLGLPSDTEHSRTSGLFSPHFAVLPKSKFFPSRDDAGEALYVRGKQASTAP